MKNIACFVDTSEAGLRLQAVIKSVVPEEKLNFLITNDALSRVLLKSLIYPEIVILLASSHEELARILELQTLLSNRKIILILPDGRSGTYRKGFRLFPKYMCDIENNSSSLKAVIKRMYTSYCLQQEGG